jgi:predicted transposase YbfD/YdcC
VADKSNEIIAIPLLLQRLELAGALVTIDAMGTQAIIAETIVARGGDYLLALKENHPLLHAEVKTFFDDPQAEISDRCETVDGNHGRIEVRRHAVCYDVAWLFSDRRYADEPRFPHLAMIGTVETQTERDGKQETEKRYYLCSTRLDAETFAHAVRAHWGIENRLHWVLDVVFRDDLSRLRTGFGPQNMAIVKHMALNLLRHPTDKLSLKNRRKRACLDPKYLGILLGSQPALT